MNKLKLILKWSLIWINYAFSQNPVIEDRLNARLRNFIGLGKLFCYLATISNFRIAVHIKPRIHSFARLPKKKQIVNILIES